MNDAIEREVFIQAGIERVWSLVSRTGFWVGEELHFDLDASEGETIIVETDIHGSFPVHVLTLDAPHYAAYRWASGFPGAELTDDNSTLVEFRLVEQDGGVMLRVTESGFATINSDLDGRTTSYNDNVEGWTHQIARLREVAEQVAVG